MTLLGAEGLNVPKRIVHGEGIWESDKLSRVEPVWVRAEYANLIPLALANGVFEVNAKKIWSTVYSYNRPDITIEKVEAILDSLEAAGLLFTWLDDSTGKMWGFWVGIKKSGRLPSPSRLKQGHQSVGAEPPADQLKGYIERTKSSQWVPNGYLGSGSGSGSGSGKPFLSETSVSDKESQPTPKSKTPPEAALALAAHLRQRILENNPKAKITEQKLRAWAAEADRMMRLDGRTEAEIRELIDWSQRDSFWSGNILSMGKLREKWDQLTLKRKRAIAGGADGQSMPQPPSPEQRKLTEEGRRTYEKFGVKVDPPERVQ